MKDIQKGEIVQAVVIADSFDSKFGPLTANKPRVRFRDFQSIINQGSFLKCFFVLVLIASGGSTNLKLYPGAVENFWCARMLRLLHLLCKCG